MPRTSYDRYQDRRLRQLQKQVSDNNWTNIQRVSIDFDNETVNGGNGDKWSIYEPISEHIANYELWTRYNQGTDNVNILESDIKIEYIRIHMRFATGESEETSAVSQTIRVLLFRYGDDWQTGESAPSIVTDVDGMPLYSELYGEINGLWMDKTFYIHSWATDADTTAGGQYLLTKVKKPLHSDTFISANAGVNQRTEKGGVWLQVVGDDPSGTNSSFYGWLEVGFYVRVA